MEQVMSQLTSSFKDKLNTDDYELESCSLWPATERKCRRSHGSTTISEMTSTCSTTTTGQASPLTANRWWKLRYQRTSPHSPITHLGKLLNELQLLEPHSCLCNSNHQSTEGQKVCHIQKVAQEECNKGDKVCRPSFTQPCQTTPTVLLKNFLPFWTDPH